MTEFNPYDRLIDACRNSSEYPYTLLKKTTSRTVLEGYHHHLFQNDAALFNSSLNPDGSKSPHRLIFWEAWPGTQSTLLHPSPLLGGSYLQVIPDLGPEFKTAEVENIKGLTEHLIRDGVDPNCRHM